MGSVERARGKNWAGLRDVERETAEWVRWYNGSSILDGHRRVPR